ncbi:MAG: hypothetical protein AAF539_12735, partial [Planctomycetota bacterium]
MEPNAAAALSCQGWRRRPAWNAVDNRSPKCPATVDHDPSALRRDPRFGDLYASVHDALSTAASDHERQAIA